MTNTEQQVVNEWYDKNGADTWPTFVCTYRYKGKEWGFSIVAENFRDARERIAALGTWGRVDGILYNEIPANPATSLYVKVMVWLKNLLRRQNG